MPPVKIYDCSLFYDEFEQLEIRFNELKDVVDKFIICEGTRTFSRGRKDLLFEKNKERFAEFLDRVIYLVFDDGNYPDKKKFAFERAQRDSLIRGLPPTVGRDDIIILSDMDEVPRAESVKRFYEDKDKEFMTLRLHHYMYYLNSLLSKRLNGPVVFRYSYLGPLSFTEMRGKRRRSPRYGNAGWHFSCLGGVGRLSEKIKAYSHSDIFSRHIPNLEHKVENRLCYYNDKPLVTVPIDDTFPLHVQNNPERWKDHICPLI